MHKHQIIKIRKIVIHSVAVLVHIIFLLFRLLIWVWFSKYICRIFDLVLAFVQHHTTHFHTPKQENTSQIDCLHTPLLFWITVLTDFLQLYSQSELYIYLYICCKFTRAFLVNRSFTHCGCAVLVFISTFFIFAVHIFIHFVTYYSIQINFRYLICSARDKSKHAWVS